MVPSVFSTGADQLKVAEPAVTAMENGPIEALLTPFEAEIVILVVVPTSAMTGVPVSWPVLELNVAQAG